MESDRLVPGFLGALLLFFFITVFFYGPKVVSDTQYAILTMFATFLAGLIGYYISGSIVTDGKWPLPGGGTINVKAAGGFAFALIGLFVFFHFSPVRSTKDASGEILQSLGDQSKTSLQSGARVGSETARIEPATRQLALQVAAADPRYASLAKLTQPNVSAKQLGDAISILQNEGGSDPTSESLERDFGGGFPPFRIGSSLAEVERLAGMPSFAFSDLPKAGELPGDIRYFWRPLRELNSAPTGHDMLQKLQWLTPCVVGDSYAAFFFNSAGGLMRISIRIMPSCTTGRQLLVLWAQTYNVRVDANASVLFQQKLRTVTVAAYAASDGVTTLDLFLNE